MFRTPEKKRNNNKTAHGSAAHNIYGVFNWETIKASRYAPVFVNEVLFFGGERESESAEKKKNTLHFWLWEANSATNPKLHN